MSHTNNCKDNVTAVAHTSETTAVPTKTDPQRLLPGFKDSRIARLPAASVSDKDLADADERKARVDRMLSEAASAEADIVEAIRSDTRELKRVMPPSQWATMGPILDRADNALAASLLTHPFANSKRLTGASRPEIPRQPTRPEYSFQGVHQEIRKLEAEVRAEQDLAGSVAPPKSERGSTRKELPQVSGDTGIRALREMQKNGGIPAEAVAKSNSKQAAAKVTIDVTTAATEPKGKRIKWTADQKELLAQQTLATGLHKAAFGQKANLAATCTAVLNTLPAFSNFGGVKQDALQQKLRSMIAEHRAKVKADPHVSGKRTGDSDDLWQAMCDMVQDIDEALAAKGEGDAAAVAEEARKNLRAEKTLAAADKTSGTGKRAPRPAQGGSSSTAPTPTSTFVTSFLKSKTDSPESKKQKLDIDRMNAETRSKEADTKMKQAETAQQQAAAAMQHQAEALKQQSEMVKMMAQITASMQKNQTQQGNSG